MSFDYAELATVAASLLADFGQNVILRNYSIGVYDPATGKSTTTTTDSFRKGAPFDFGAGQTNGTGGLIQAGDKRLLLEPGTVPSLEDHIIFGGLHYVIKGLGEINPAGTPVLYDLHLRT